MSDDLQFDRAERGTPAEATACAGCGRALTDVYFVAQDARFCSACRSTVEAQYAGPTPMQLATAAAAGVAAGVATNCLYALVLRESIGVSLVALFSGMIVGFAVRKGSGNRGGRTCQIIALALTALTIVGAFIPDLFALPEGMTAIEYLKRRISIWVVVLTGFALFEAWRVNQAPRVAFHGPFRVGEKGPPHG